MSSFSSHADGSPPSYVPSMFHAELSVTKSVFIHMKSEPKLTVQSVSDIMAAARKDRISPMELCERITDGDQLPAGLKPAIKKNLASFVGIIRKLRKAAQKVCLISSGLADE